MARIPIHDYAACEPGMLTGLGAELQRLETLADVLAWGRASDPPATIIEIVTQDEYTHDVVLESNGRPYLAFDTTGLGAVTAVAVFRTRPDARILLDARPARGWQPTPSGLRDGPRVLGYAACVVAPQHRDP